MVSIDVHPEGVPGISRGEYKEPHLVGGWLTLDWPNGVRVSIHQQTAGDLVALGERVAAAGRRELEKRAEDQDGPDPFADTPKTAAA